MENHSLISLCSNSLDVEGIKVLLILYSAGYVSDNLFEVALLRLVHFFLVLNLKVEKDTMVNLALIPSPLVVKKAINGGRLEEGVVVSNNYASNQAPKEGKTKRGSEGSKLEACLLAWGSNFGVKQELILIIVTEVDKAA